MNESGLRPSSCLEFIAQAYGYGSACHKIQTQGLNAKPAARAFLASFKDVKFAPPQAFQVPADTTLDIRVTSVRQVAAIASIKGQVLCHGKELCRASLKVFIANQ